MHLNSTGYGAFPVSINYEGYFGPFEVKGVKPSGSKGTITLGGSAGSSANNSGCCY